MPVFVFSEPGRQRQRYPGQIIGTTQLGDADHWNGIHQPPEQTGDLMMTTEHFQ